ncbi:aldo/keto reductase family protein [Aspergillus brunneoviolaceus CBS 621.78]|uniref:Aldehyde reductase n=1 Tax=Aspergillus brunneoviolaceus CBS 621.78 TaxID=1450534 RepID=A0ACD1GGA7_9EURO|nr:putative aldehyde reductase [Aspergillus brunneoviolaceus CBS 621.78]RAH48198.1 putative aldehyde reductase [Aspergillus brunneoviolaceus CBS 621.78]
MSTSRAKIVFGAGLVNDSSKLNTAEKTTEILQVLKRHNITQIDTAQIYGRSEELLGQANAAAQDFDIDTKHGGGFRPGRASREAVIADAEESLRKLNTDSVNIFYIHAPDRTAPIEPTLAGINDLYHAGKFKHFGLSNFTAAETEEVLRLCQEHDYVRPTVYQGNYNAISRLIESSLFPLLREHGIQFYAYSPIAGGFLTKTSEQLRTASGSGGRWDPDSGFGKVYRGLYMKPEMLRVLDTWNEVAEKAGISKAELAYRWVAYHSALDGELGDAIIAGASGVEQLDQTLTALEKGPLEDEVLRQIEAIWEVAKEFAVLDNFNSR